MGGEDDPPLTRKETEGSTSGTMTDNNQQLQDQDMDMVTFMSQGMEEQRKAQHAMEITEKKEMCRQKAVNDVPAKKRDTKLPDRNDWLGGIKAEKVERENGVELFMEDTNEAVKADPIGGENHSVEPNAKVVRKDEMRLNAVGKTSVKVGRKSDRRELKDRQVGRTVSVRLGVEGGDGRVGKDQPFAVHQASPDLETKAMKEENKNVKEDSTVKRQIVEKRKIGRNDGDRLRDKGGDGRVDNVELSNVCQATSALEIKAKKGKDEGNRKKDLEVVEGDCSGRKAENEVKKKKKGSEEQEEVIQRKRKNFRKRIISSSEEEESNLTKNLGGELKDFKIPKLELCQKKVGNEGRKPVDEEGNAETMARLQVKEGTENDDVTVDVDNEESLDLSLLDEPTKTENLKEVLCMAEVGGGYNVRFTAGYDHQAILDTGCSRSCASEEWTEAYIRLLGAEDRKEVVRKPSNNRFRFGDRKLFASEGLVTAPIYIGSRRKTLTWDVLKTDVPLLIGLPIMKQLGMVLEFSKDGSDVARVNGNAEAIEVINRDGHQWISLTREAESVEHRSLRVSLEESSQIKKLHVNLAHPPRSGQSTAHAVEGREEGQGGSVQEDHSDQRDQASRYLGLAS